jgi:hypothetical protein
MFRVPWKIFPLSSVATSVSLASHGELEAALPKYVRLYTKLTFFESAASNSPWLASLKQSNNDSKRTYTLAFALTDVGFLTHVGFGGHHTKI